ncbi:VanW family protein [Actinomycetota bacterium Odt1-20B]
MRRNPASSTTRRIPMAARVGIAAGLGVGGAYVLALASAGNEIPDGTTVRGVNIGGLSQSAAADRLDTQLGPRANDPLKVKVGDGDATVDPRTAGLSLDSAATAERAARPGISPVAVFNRLFSDGDEMDPVVRVDEKKARTALAAAARKHERKPQDGAISFKQGEATAKAPQNGLRLDVDAAVGALREAHLSTDGRPAQLPVKETEPKVGKDRTEHALKNVARPAVSAPVTLTVEGKKVTISQALLGTYLKMKPNAEGDLKPQLNAKGLLADPALSSQLSSVTTKATEATLGVEGNRVVVQKDGKAGREITEKALREAVLPLLTKTGAERTGTVAVQTVQPKVTSKTIGKLGIKEKISEFTVNFEPAPYRTKNIGRAAELLNGSVALPGQTWSFNNTVGERTKENGFVDGIMINNGRYERAAGGGVSAVATTVFNAMFFAGVKPVEYGAHSFYIERYPEGREATVAWGSLDLRFLNDSGNAIYVRTKATDRSITVTFLGTKKYDEIKSEKGPRTNVQQPKKRDGAKGAKCEPQTPLEGFDVTVQRIFMKDGKEVKREPFRTHYTPRDEISCS